MRAHWSDDLLGIDIWLPEGTTPLFEADEDGRILLFLKPVSNLQKSREELAFVLEHAARELRGELNPLARCLYCSCVFQTPEGLEAHALIHKIERRRPA